MSIPAAKPLTLSFDEALNPDMEGLELMTAPQYGLMTSFRLRASLLLRDLLAREYAIPLIHAVVENVGPGRILWHGTLPGDDFAEFCRFEKFTDDIDDITPQSYDFWAMAGSEEGQSCLVFSPDGLLDAAKRLSLTKSFDPAPYRRTLDDLRRSQAELAPMGDTINARRFPRRVHNYH